jgi:hypothetical protein
MLCTEAILELLPSTKHFGQRVCALRALFQEVNFIDFSAYATDFRPSQLSSKYNVVP